MTIYYRGPRALVTEDVLEVWVPQHHVFRIRELTAVYVVRCVAGRRPIHALPVVAVAVAVAVPIAESSAGLPAVAVLVAAASLLTAACLRPPVQPYELHGIHRGREVRLFRSADARAFGQVRRALTRAMERHADW
jgi:hypothetical protein